MGKILPKRFLDKIIKTDSCWLWAAYKSREGYGKYREGVNMLLAHRVSWEFFNDKIPEGILVLHRCDVPSCVNPTHLFLGTDKDNSDDKITKGRAVYLTGEQSGNVKLTRIQVEEIRKTYVKGSRGSKSEYSETGLSRKFGVSPKQIRDIVNYRSWKTVALETINA